jgi:hypothetical protein
MINQSFHLVWYSENLQEFMKQLYTLTDIANDGESTKKAGHAEKSSCMQSVS